MIKVIFGVVVLIVLVVGYVFISNKQDASALTQQVQDTTQIKPIPTEPQVATYSVAYSDSGYAQKELTIKAGDSVTFTNNSTRVLMTAFGEHATHDEYPDKKAHPTLEIGMSDTITFPVAGTFDYHNHHAEDDTGTIVVE